MLSSSSWKTGIREYPCRNTRACTSRSDRSLGIAVTSGRGTITSRTIVSPNSKIEWISSTSSSSICSSSEATSASWRSSRSVMNGPCGSPRPGITTSPRSRRPSSSRSSGSSGNESTSVGPSSSRYRTCRSAISSSVTRDTESSTSVAPSPRRVRRAGPSSASRSTTTSLCRSSITMRGPGWFGSAIGVGAALAEQAVGLDDVLHDLVPDDVPSAEVGELDPVDPLEDLLHDHEAGGLPGRQIHLRHVPVHDGLRAEPDPREEHLHLLGRGVLRLVEDDERVVQGPPSEVRDRRHLDRPALHQPRERVGARHLEQRVVQRLHVRIDLLVE